MGESSYERGSLQACSDLICKCSVCWAQRLIYATSAPEPGYLMLTYREKERTPCELPLSIFVHINLPRQHRYRPADLQVSSEATENGPYHSLSILFSTWISSSPPPRCPHSRLPYRKSEQDIHPQAERHLPDIVHDPPASQAHPRPRSQGIYLVPESHGGVCSATRCVQVGRRDRADQ